MQKVSNNSGMEGGIYRKAATDYSNNIKQAI